MLACSKNCTERVAGEINESCNDGTLSGRTKNTNVPASLRLSTTGFDPRRFLLGSFSSRSSSSMFSRVFVALTFTSSHLSSMARTRFLCGKKNEVDMVSIDRNTV